MSILINPFVRGYQNLQIQRLLAVQYSDDCPMAYLPLHSSQAYLRDEELLRHPCIFCDDFVLVTEGLSLPISDELEDQCPSIGVILTVIYAVVGDDAGTPVHVGDTYSYEAAREVVRRLSFQTGHYSRCWEISSAHLTQEALRYLESRAIGGTLEKLLFEVFRPAESANLGVKLNGTPWTTENLRLVEGIEAERLRLHHRNAGVPDSLVTVLHLAAQAEVRILIFDPDAPTLNGLPLYDN
jgi:hypothetical protein